MTTPIDKVLPLLERVRQTRPGRWMACCPAHEDRSPSLGIAELDDDRVLINCRAGCSVVEVLAALGLDMSDLYPSRPGEPGGGHKPVRRPFNATDLIDLAAFESGVAVVIVSDMLNHRPEPDFDRLLVAAGRLADVKEAVHGRR